MGLLRQKWTTQSVAAAARGIQFELTFEQWLHIWQKSGKLKQRGRRSHEYCMARNGDKGAYCVGNVSIITNRQNAEQQDYKARSSAMSRAKLGNKNRLGVPHTKDVKRRISKSLKRTWSKRQTV